jgi:hypothetical protein
MQIRSPRAISSLKSPVQLRLAKFTFKLYFRSSEFVAKCGLRRVFPRYKFSFLFATQDMYMDVIRIQA